MNINILDLILKYTTIIYFKGVKYFFLTDKKILLYNSSFGQKLPRSSSIEIWNYPSGSLDYVITWQNPPIEEKVHINTTVIYSLPSLFLLKPEFICQ